MTSTKLFGKVFNLCISIPSIELIFMVCYLQYFFCPQTSILFIYFQSNLESKTYQTHSDANCSREYLLLFILILYSVSLLLGKKTSMLYFFSHLQFF